MEPMTTYDTVSEALRDLHRRGYYFNFNETPREHPEFLDSSGNLVPGDFRIDEAYRFEGSTDPGDENLVLAISSPKYQVKGTLVNALGAYADPIAAALVAKLKYRADIKG